MIFTETQTRTNNDFITCPVSWDWQRRRGWPRRTWLCTLEHDFQPFYLGLDSAWQHAQE